MIGGKGVLSSLCNQIRSKSDRAPRSILEREIAPDGEWLIALK